MGVVPNKHRWVKRLSHGRLSEQDLQTNVTDQALFQNYSYSCGWVGGEWHGRTATIFYVIAACGLHKCRVVVPLETRECKVLACDTGRVVGWCPGSDPFYWPTLKSLHTNIPIGKFGSWRAIKSCLRVEACQRRHLLIILLGCHFKPMSIAGRLGPGGHVRNASFQSHKILSILSRAGNSGDGNLTVYSVRFGCL